MFEKVFLLQLLKQPSAFVVQKRGAAEQRAALAHVHAAVFASPVVKAGPGALVQGFEVGFVETGGRLQFGDENLVGLLQQAFLDFVQQIGFGYPEAVLRDIRTKKVDVTFPELIPGYAAAPSGLLPAP